MSDWAATRRLPAAIMLAAGDIVIGDVHLQVSVPHRAGEETPLEMLNRADGFFPLSLADGGVLFLSREGIAVMSCASTDIPEGDPERLQAALRLQLEVRLVGAEYRGQAAIEMPPSRARTLDYLNGSGRFFMIVTGNTTRFINRTYVKSVRPLD